MICLQVQEILDEDEALSTDPSQGRHRTRRVLARSILLLSNRQQTRRVLAMRHVL